MKYTLLPYGRHPERGSEGAAGFDFFIPSNFSHTIMEPNDSVLIKTGVKLIIPENKVGIFFNRSSIGSQGVILGAKVVDSDYRGEIFINLINVGHRAFMLRSNMKIAQLIVSDFYKEIEEIDLIDYNKHVTIRNTGALGSTNKGE